MTTNNKNANTNNTAATKVITGKGRLSYAYVWEPHVSEESDSQEPKYSTSFLFPKSDKETIAKINTAIKAAIELGIKTKWGGKKPAKLKLPIRDGDMEADEKGEAYEGNYFFNATSKRAPDIVDQKKRPIIDDHDELYSGCYARLSVNFYPFEAKGNKGVAVGLNNIQKWADGEPLGAVVSKAEDDFDALEDAGTNAGAGTGGDFDFDVSGDLPFGEDDDSGDLPFGEYDAMVA